MIQITEPNMRPLTMFASTATAIIIAGSVLSGAVLHIAPDAWLAVAFASLILCALIWVIRTNVSSQQQFKAAAEALERQMAVHRFESLKPELDDLMRVIASETGILSTPADGFAKATSDRTRASLAPLLTAEHGTRLRTVFQNTANVRRAQLEQSLQAYIQVFETATSPNSADSRDRVWLTQSPYARVLWAIQAALAETDDDALPFVRKLMRTDSDPTAASA